MEVFRNREGLGAGPGKTGGDRSQIDLTGYRETEWVATGTGMSRYRIQISI
jgi:hypothetical protein